MSKRVPYKRRKYFIKQWMQLRIMIVFGAATVAGGVVFGYLAQSRLSRLIRVEMYRSHSKFQTLWDVLYPEVMKMTLTLFVVVMIALLVIFRLYTSRINRSAAALDAYIKRTMRGPSDEPVDDEPIVREFREYARSLSGLMDFYRERWKGIADEARETIDVCRKVEIADPGQARDETIEQAETKLSSLVNHIAGFGERNIP